LSRITNNLTGATNGNVIVFSNGNWSVGTNGGGGGGGTGGVAIAAGGSTASSGTVKFSNAHGVSFGMAGSNVTASVLPQTSFIFSNANGLVFGTSGSTITGSYTVPSTVPLTVSAGSLSTIANGLTFSNSNGVSFGLNGLTITGSVAPALVNISDR